MKNFIIFEGPDFSGKTTIMNKLMEEHLSNPIGINTREPGSYLVPSSFKCESYRQQLLSDNNTAIQEAKIFAESRLYHTRDIIKYLEFHNIFCDRYIVSSLAYQGYAQDLGKKEIYRLNKESLNLLKANGIKMNIIKFNISKEEWLKRRNKRLKVSNLDTIESKNIDYKVLNFYSDNEIYKDYTDKLNAIHYDIDANLSVDDIYKNVMKIIKNI